MPFDIKREDLVTCQQAAVFLLKSHYVLIEGQDCVNVAITRERLLDLRKRLDVYQLELDEKVKASLASKLVASGMVPPPPEAPKAPEPAKEVVPEAS